MPWTLVSSCLMFKVSAWDFTISFELLMPQTSSNLFWKDLLKFWRRKWNLQRLSDPSNFYRLLKFLAFLLLKCYNFAMTVQQNKCVAPCKGQFRHRIFMHICAWSRRHVLKKPHLCEIDIIFWTKKIGSFRRK